MAHRLLLLRALAVFSAILTGCGSASLSRKTPAVAASAPAAGPLSPALLTLDEIQPPVTLTVPPPASQPTTSHAPIEAITLYAQAVDALKTGRRFTAINLLEKALQLDPQSFELNYALGRAHLIGRTHDENSIAALERAAALNPDHLEIQTDLGRQYMLSGNDAKALEHLRLAVQTSDYKSDEPMAADADLFLARALQQSGYDRAALEQYASLLSRVKGRSLSVGRDPHLAFLITDRLYIDIGDLYARNGQLDDALAAFEPAARRDPTDFELEARVVRAMVGLKHFDDASRRAADAVVHFRASKPSLDLLREVHRAASGGAKDNGDRATIDALAKALRERPNDTTILFELVELLRDSGKWAAAEGYLTSAADRMPGDFSIVRRRVQLRLERDDSPGAARLLIETLAARPEFAAETDELWEDVTNPARANHVTLAQLRSLPVLPSQAGAREFAVAMVAIDLHRSALAEQAMQRATQATPPFVPAFRARLKWIWQRRGIDEAERLRLTDAIIASAPEPALAQELRGLSLLYQKKDKDAVAALEKANELHAHPSAAMDLSYAMALRGAGDGAKFEQLMWKLLSDHPSSEDAYATLYSYYTDTGAEAQADRVLSTWMSAIPYSTSARVLQVARAFRAGRPEAAQDAINRLLDERPGDAGIIRTAYAVYSKSSNTDALITRLEEAVRAEPGNVAALSALLDLYVEKHRTADAIPLIDAARQALFADADNLYQVAHLYAQVGKREANEDVLRRVLEADPAHPPASNDLGYGLAERGENLPRAEALIRQAVEAEPDNASFLDSLGWVLYKRGKFAEARPALEKAIGPDAKLADPVVLDHLGDDLYRLGEKDAAAKQWQQAAAKLTENTADAERDDLKELKTALDRKAEELKSGKPVTVSPVIEEARQAKN